jgi:RNA polymerase-interacting CarD/CdnL/TRCF family regulator
MNQPAPMRLAVGDLVVYGAHGVGRVTANDGRAAEQAILVLEFDAGLRVSLPVARARESLRPLSNQQQLAEVERTLRAHVTPDQQQWSQRFRATREKLTAGQATGLAEIVRDTLHRERERGAIASPAEQELCLKARRLLALEISMSRGIDQLDADEWIAEQIEQRDPVAATAVTAAR